MARSTHSLLGYVRSWLASARTHSGSDGELLRRFVKRRDETAFAELLDRHGAMILGLCHRLIGDSHIAEDVFQATFLVLARKGRSIRRPDSLGAWLYGVAYRLALKARTKQKRQEPQAIPDRAAPGPDPLDDISARELLATIDAELQQLPDVYRLPLIHCCLEGRSLEEAALLLGWTPGSVKGRLERGRSRLRDRLARHGLTLPAVLGPSLLLASPSLAASFAQKALPLARSAGVSPAVMSLADDGVRGLLTAKLKAAVALSIAVSLIGIGIGLGIWVSQGGSAVQDQAVSHAAESLVAMTRNPDREAQAITPADEHPLPTGAAIRLGSVNHRHILARAIVFQPDAMAVNTFGQDGTLRSWQPETGKLLSVIALPGDGNLDTALSHDGKTLMRVNGDRVEFWRPGPQPTMYFRTFFDLKKAVLAPDGKTFATVEGAPVGNVLKVHTLEPFESRTMGKLASFPGDVVISPDGQRVITSIALDGMIRCWDGKQEGPAWAARISATKINISPNGQWLIVQPEHRDARFKLLSVATGKQPDYPPLPLVDTFWSATISPDGSLFCCVGNKGVLVWNLRDGLPVFQIPGEAHDAAFSPDGQTLAALSGGIHVYRVATGKPVFNAAIDDGHTTPVMGLAWSPDGHRLISHAVQGRNDVLLWDVAHPKPRRIDGAFRTLARADFLRDGKRVVALSFDGQAYVADFASAKEIGHRALVAEAEGRAFDGTLSRNGRRAVFRFDRGEHKAVPQVAWIDPTTGMIERTITLPESFGRKALLSADGRVLYNPRGEQFDPEWQRVLPPLQIPANLMLDEKAVCSADGSLIAIPLYSGNDEQRGRDGVGVWERATGQLLRMIPSQQPLGSIAISPDGGTIAVGDDDQVVVVEVATGAELARFDLPPRPKTIGDDWAFCPIAFSPDNTRLATGHFDSRILIWNVPARRLHSMTRVKAWDRLAEDIGKAALALDWLTANRTEALALLSARINPVPPVDVARVGALIADLGSNELAVRDAATRSLSEMGDGIVPHLKNHQKGNLSAEQTRCIAALIRQFDTSTPPTGEALRIIRITALLERLGSTDAMRILEHMSRGDPSSRATGEASAVLQRLRDQ